MGKIDIPKDTSSEKSSPKVSKQPDELVTTNDEISFNTEDARRLLGKDEVEITEEDLSLTNEAVRLIHLKKELGIDATNTDHDREIKRILEWARESGIKNRNQLFSELREIKYKLGITEFDGDALKRIYQYVVIDGRIKNLVNKQQAIINGNR